MPDAIDIEIKIIESSQYYKKRADLKAKGALDNVASEAHKLVYDSSSETLEPVYFWVLDQMNSMFDDVKKVIDNFASSPGSGHFSEIGMKATKMQEESMKIMQTSGVLIKSVINIIYDLKEFELRLSQYKSADSKDKLEAEAGLLALKQIWMDNVDMKRGNGSINAMTAGNLNFVTLRDAFMAANSLAQVKEMDLNDRVKRILEPRLQEFLKWKELSEKELRKRYEIEKTYLKNQLSSLKLYARWSKPYLKAAAQLEQNVTESKSAALVNAFNTIVFELTLLGKKKFDFTQAAIDKTLPESFKDKNLKRKYYQCVLVDFFFRGIPQRVGTNYVFGGRAEVAFKGYALNDDELKMLEQKLDKSDLNDVMKLVAGMTDDSIKELQEDIDYFLKPEEERLADKKKSSADDTNPFSALFGMSSKKSEKKEEKKEEIKSVKPDNYVEKMIRALTEAKAKEACFTVFDIYKKAHGMASHPAPEFEPGKTGFPGKTFIGLKE